MKKTRELIHLEHFKEVCLFFPEGEIEKTEKPDFIVHASHKHLGIEHTEMFQPGDPHGQSMQAQDSLAQRVVDKANQLYLQNHSQPLLVQILFKTRGKMGKQDVQRIAKMVVHIIEETTIESGSPMTLQRTRQNSEHFPKEIAMIHVYYHPNGKENRWVCSSIGFVPQLTPEQLQEKIDKKEQKLDSYSSKCCELWLLIVADDLRIPSSVDLTVLASTHHYSTRFDRVFFYWNASRKYVELQLANAN
ncbi:MAG: hypothetical protein NTW12_15540 [Deltaproteobacteria bacterium]|nr:hypothetical protein [Deltaproteobacteria bacterium]